VNVDDPIFGVQLDAVARMAELDDQAIAGRHLPGQAGGDRDRLLNHLARIGRAGAAVQLAVAHHGPRAQNANWRAKPVAFDADLA